VSDEEQGAGATPAPAPAARRRIPVWQESLLLLGLAIVLALVVKTFLVQAFYIPSGSMEPGLEINDRILVQKVSYWSGGPERGDIVVFEDPGDWLSAAETTGPTNVLTDLMSRIGLYPTGGHLVKRVIGVAGDTIECCDDQGRLLVNGVPLDSSGFTLNQDRCDGPMISTCQWSAGPVPEGSIFVMGDHRDDSADSSFHLRCGGRKDEPCDDSDAYVPVDLVVGKVFARVWPASRFDLLEKPDAFDALQEELDAAR
jgi:signal peptidase I